MIIAPASARGGLEAEILSTDEHRFSQMLFFICVHL